MAPTRFVCLLTLLAAGSAFAAEDDEKPPEESSEDTTEEQSALDATDRDDLEYQKSTAPLKKVVEGLSTSFTFDFEFHEVNNLDFRKLDEEHGDQGILDSDDRSGFTFSGIGLRLDYEVDEKVDLTLGASHRGLWGTDQLGGTNRFGGWIYFTNMFVDYHPWGKDGVHFRLGRQPFEIGGIAGTRDYVWADINDMIRVDVPVGELGSVTLIPIDVAASTPNTDDVNFAGYIASSTSSPWNFRGRNRTLRTGGMFRLAPKKSAFQATAYGFFTSVGAGGARRDGTPGTGADISYAGELGNFADNDWIMNGGLRVQYATGKLAFYGELDGSTGIDRKEEVAYDVDTTGAAWGAGAVYRPEEGTSGPIAQLSYFEALGAAYADDGMQYSHGYVGMKGRQIDGLIANRYLGMHPTAYLGWAGVEDDMHESDRKSGTRVIQLRAGYQNAGPITIFANGLFLQDTGYTELDLDRLDTIDPPYGYSSLEFAAEERIGKIIGIEGDLQVWIEASEHLRFNVSSGIFVPGEYYKIEVARVAGTQLGSADAPPAWVINGGTHVRF